MNPDSLQPMTMRFTLGLRRLQYEHQHACSVCGHAFVQDDLYHLGYDRNGDPLIVGNCCRDHLSETAVRHGFYPRRFISPEMNANLWRYTNLAKFVSLLATKSIFFARMDTFDDPFECAIGLGLHREWYRKAKYESFVARAIEVVNTPVPGYGLPPKEARERNIAQLISDYEGREEARLSERIFASCWHESKTESAALWKLYGGSDGSAVAIKTTYKSLRDGILDRDEEGDRYKIDIGRVEYIDYENVILHHLDAPFRKRAAFEHEKEVRAIFRFHAEDLPAGIGVPVDLANVVSDVVVSPLAPQWFGDLVVELCRRFDCPLKVSPSGLNVEPLYY
jgi:hypothetical protein